MVPIVSFFENSSKQLQAAWLFLFVFISKTTPSNFDDGSLAFVLFLFKKEKAYEMCQGKIILILKWMCCPFYMKEGSTLFSSR